MKNKTMINLKSRRGFLKGISKWIGGTTLLATSTNLIIAKEIKAASYRKSFLAEGTPYLGSICMVGFNFAPIGWALCDGQLLPISENDALFSLLGTTYGGDGQNTFALPDLRGRVPIHRGQGPGLPSYDIGERGGQESVTLITNQIPLHNHTLAVNSNGGTSDNPAGNYMASNSEGIKHYSNSAGSSANGGSIGTAGGSQPHNNMPPYLCVNFIIALEGLYPQQN
jgi:microcystin-dependent protein